VNHKKKITKKRFCSLKKLQNDCTRRVCCTKIYRHTLYAYQTCKKGKISCPIKRRRWCKVIETSNGCKRKRCCNKKIRNGKTVFLKCNNGRAFCPVKSKMTCHRTKLGKCHSKRCCRVTWSYRSRRWVLNKRTCKYHKRCKSRVIKCKWSKLAHGCAERSCIKTFYKKKKVFRVKRWKNKRVCYEQRKFKCQYNKTLHGCRIKNCCLSISFEGKVVKKKM